MIPRFGLPPEPGIKYRRRPGAYAFLWRDGRVLLTHQARPEPEFQLPGGGIDPGENAIRALHREVVEETGWTISTPRRVFDYRRFCYMPEYDLYAEKRCSIWLARPILHISEPLDPCHTTHWVSVDDALQLLADPGSRIGVKRAVEMVGRQAGTPRHPYAII